MLSDRMDDSMRRSLLLRLAEIVLNAIGLADGRFDHKFMSDGEAATWLICTLQLARRTRTGFDSLVPASDRVARIAAIPAAELPLLEDAIDATILSRDYIIPRVTDWPPDPDIFPEEYDSVFEDLGLLEQTGVWTDAALPILVWNGCLTAEAIRSGVVAGAIARLAVQALAAMPQEVLDVMTEDHQRGKPVQRLPHYLSNGWRPQGWLTPAQRRIAGTYMANPLAYAVAREIMHLRGLAQV